jgi:hypothetical protein
MEGISGKISAIFHAKKGSGGWFSNGKVNEFSNPKVFKK